MPLSPAIMLCSQQWRHRFPESIPVLIRIMLLRDARLVAHNLALLHCFYRYELWRAMTAPNPIIIVSA